MAHDGGLFLRDILAPTKTLGIMASTRDASPYPEIETGPLHTRSSNLGWTSSFNASAILEQQQQHQLQVIAATFSSCSVLAALCAIYWFCMMRRNFRRDLILLLICGDAWKSIWFLVFSSLSMSRGAISTTSAFCQASGYFLQAGVEACDIAILLMSVHMQLQIFPPRNSFIGHDGLYRIRRWVLAIWFIFPNVLASLAFTNHYNAFVAQGGFCTLPIRPYWYRLALSWIPRYLIWLYVMFVAIRIYRHVGFEFKVFGQERDGSSSFGNISSSANTRPANVIVPMQHSQSSHSDAATAEKGPGTEDDIAPDDDDFPPTTPTQRLTPALNRPKMFDPKRRSSVPTWAAPFGNGPGIEHMEGFAGPQSTRSKSNPNSRRGSRQIATTVGGTEDFAPPTLPPSQHRGSVSTIGSLKSSRDQSSHDTSLPGLGTITEQQTKEAEARSPSDIASAAMKHRRKAIQRQLRLLFIYPVVYLMMWVIPFVAHALNYSNNFAQHPIFAISGLSIFCQASMGIVDVTVFTWREKPWRHIPGSDGTFFGSFLFWRFAFGQQWAEQRRKSSAPMGMRPDEKTSDSTSGLLKSLKRWSMSFSGKGPSPKPSNASISGAAALATPSPAKTRAPPMHRRAHSGGSDRRILEAERAQERLALERAEFQQYRRSFTGRRASVVSNSNLASASLEQQQITTPTRKEWWDRHMSITDDLT